MFSLVFRPLTRWFESEVNLVSGSVVLTAGRKAPAFRRFQCEAGRLNRTTFCENCCMDVLQCFQQGVAGHLVDYKKNPAFTGTVRRICASTAQEGKKECWGRTMAGKGTIPVGCAF